MSFPPPFSAPVPRPTPTTVFIIGFRVGDAERFADMLSIPLGRWIFTAYARQLLGASSASTLLVCPGAYKSPNFTEVYNGAKIRGFNILYLDEEKQPRK